MARYAPTSPYYRTPKTAGYLGVYEPRTFKSNKDDIEYKIDRWYSQRPDLLAYDLYGNDNLWWVFQARNPNAFEDPIWDFQTGVKFYLPKKETIDTALGI